MFGRRLLLFRIYDFKIQADLSWFILVFLVTFSLVIGTFPQFYPGLSLETYFLMGVVGAIGLFASIIIHELCHSIVGRHYNMPIHEITLFLFGGVAHLEDEPPSPKSEFNMAIAGPLASVALGFFFAGLHVFGDGMGWGSFVLGVLAYLMQVNFLVAIFNMIPAFPLDGGRIFRSILWAVKRDLRWATRVASLGGQGFGFFLIALGLAQFFMLQSIGGFWLVFLGFLLRGIAKASYQQLIVKQALHGRSVERFMDTDPLVASPGMTVGEFIRHMLQQKETSLFPVVEENQLFGFVRLQELLAVPERDWDQTLVSSLVNPDIGENSIRADADAERALHKMNQSGQNELLVVRDRRLLGVLSISSLTRFLALAPAKAA